MFNKIWQGLFCSTDNLVSSSKFWTNVGAGTATYLVITLANAGNLSVEIFGTYCVCLIAPNLAQKISYIVKGKSSNLNASDNSYQQ